MSAAEVLKAAFELSAEERLDLARRLVESVVAPTSLNETIAQGVQRIEDIATGRVKGLNEDEFRANLAGEKRC
jgi:hypothetical protein